MIFDAFNLEMIRVLLSLLLLLLLLSLIIIITPLFEFSVFLKKMY